MKRLIRILAAFRAWQLLHRWPIRGGDFLVLRTGTQHSMAFTYFFAQELQARLPAGVILLGEHQNIPSDKLHRWASAAFNPRMNEMRD